MPSILITGCSSGFGRDIAQLFLDRGWEVVATMRDPAAAAFAPSDRLRVVALDVTDAASIAGAIAEAGPIDALVNNAGIGLMNAIEAAPIESVRALFETNVIGPIALTRAVIPQMRARGAGVIVNISSGVTLTPVRMLSAYTASKAALNAFSEIVALELEPFGIRVRVVLPGRSPETAFGATAQAGQPAFPDAYQPQVQALFAARTADAPVTFSADVAEAVWQAVTDPSAPAQIPAGADALGWAANRRVGSLAEA